MPTPFTITIGESLVLTAEPPYIAGQPTSPAEADVLNSVWIDNVTKNFQRQAKQLFEAAGETPEVLEQLRASWLDYTQEYKLAPVIRRTARDPVLAEARKIALASIRAYLNRNSIEEKTLPPGKLDSMVATVIERKPEVMAEARRRVEATIDVAEGAMGL